MWVVDTVEFRSILHVVGLRSERGLYEGQRLSVDLTSPPLPPPTPHSPAIQKVWPKYREKYEALNKMKYRKSLQFRDFRSLVRYTVISISWQTHGHCDRQVCKCGSEAISITTWISECIENRGISERATTTTKTKWPNKQTNKHKNADIILLIKTSNLFTKIPKNTNCNHPAN